MDELSARAHSTVQIEPLWVPSRGLDPDSYDDVFAHSTANRLPARAAISDAGGDEGARGWCSLLAEGFVADHLTTVDDVKRSIPIRAAVFAAQSAMGMVPVTSSVRAGLVGVTLFEGGEGVAVSAGGFTVLRVSPDGTVLRWNAKQSDGLAVFDDLSVHAKDRDDVIDRWTFSWRSGDTVLVCGRGVPETLLGGAAGWFSDSLPAFQGRIRKAFLTEGSPRSATVVRMKLG